MISFFTADISYSLRSRGDLRLWLSEVARKEGFKIAQLNVIFCSDEYLYAMNVQYLQHKTYTDIITFDQSDRKGVISGELYISLDRLRDNSKSLKISLKDEIHRVIVHGVLHLCGYGDKTPADKAAMTSKEDYYLAKRSFSI